MLDTQSTTFFLNLEEAYVIDSTDTTLTIELPRKKHPCEVAHENCILARQRHRLLFARHCGGTLHAAGSSQGGWHPPLHSSKDMTS